MPKCGCSGQTCGCRLVSGSGVGVTGTGTASDPFVLSVDAGSLGFGNAIRVTNSSSIEMTKTGSGGQGDPVLIGASVVLRSPNNARWGLTVSNTGALGTVAL